MIAIAVAVLSALLVTPTRAHAQESAYTYINQQDRSLCRRHADGASLDQDWISYRCAGFAGITVWLTFNDSAYMNLSFGSRDGERTSYLLAERNPQWPLEWRHSQGRPYAVIARMVRPDLDDLRSQVTTLVVYGLRAGAGSCILGFTASNTEARQIADRFSRERTCPD